MRKNIGTKERVFRLMVAEVLFLGAFFWTATMWSIVLALIASVFLVTALIGFCPLYTVLRIDWSKDNASFTGKSLIGTSLFLLIILFGGGYASHFLTKKLFVEDFNTMNAFYKQTLFETGQEKRVESIKNYDALVSSFAQFQEKYATYRPFALRGDTEFVGDLDTVAILISGLRTEIESGNLKNAHLTLEKIRPITQEMFKRNGFSMLSIALVDFHDLMEQVLDPANAKDAVGVISAYPQANIALQTVEEIANDGEIQAIRANLEAIFKLAQEKNIEALPAKASELKSSFVKVYLVRG